MSRSCDEAAAVSNQSAFNPNYGIQHGVYHFIKVYAEAAVSTQAVRGAVGTGWTGGVDSLFTVLENLRAKNTAYQLTHLMIASNGAIMGTTPTDTLEKMGKKAEQGILTKLDFDLLCIDSNLLTALPENFLTVTELRHAATILAFQKLFKSFLVSSGIASYTYCSFRPENMSFYAFIVLGCLGTECTAFYSTGYTFTRIEKLRCLSEIPLAWQMLHPCIYALRDNCGTCGKCIRTQLELYALGMLERFSAVFDVARFQEKRTRYLAMLSRVEK